MSFESLEVDSTRDLVAKVLELARNAGSPRTLWFRGHLESSWALTPSLNRKLERLEELFPAERKLMTRFRQRSLPFWQAGYPQTPWEHMFSMQHYGVPTRLLDWSENLFVGLYFSVVPMFPGYKAAEDESPCIWVINPKRWNQLLGPFGDLSGVGVFTTDTAELESYEPDEDRRDELRREQPVAMYGTYNSPRIVAQRGTFMVSGRSLKSFDQFAPDETVLWQVKLNYPRDEVLQDLDQLGFAQSMMFPDLTGLSREIAVAEGLG